MTLREIIYMCIDLLKLSSDDSFYTLDHIKFLCNKYRIFLLHQRYTDIRKPISQSNYSTICQDLIEVPAISGEPCEGGSYLRSKEKIPFILKGTYPIIYPIDFYQGINITYVSRERMRFVGHNKWMQNIIYCSLGPDNYLYFKSPNPQFLHLEKIRINAIFEDWEQANKLSCEGDSVCDIEDAVFPIEDNLVPQLIQLVVQELRGAEYNLVEDNFNNSHDDLPEQQRSRK